MSPAKRAGAKGPKGKPPSPPPRARLAEPHPERPPIPLVIAVVLTAVLEVLDMTIVNVAIPNMLGAFAATPDQITWVLTSYIVAAAVVMPLTGYLSTWLGRRRLLLFAITGFVVSSALCGMAWNLESMVVFRLAQGVFGAPLVPLSQGILLDAFPRERHGQALAIFGLGIMVAPVIGPALGGYLTETYSWRTVFYINIPIGLIALLLSVGYLPRRPIKELKTDWVGMGLLVLAVGALQYVLDQGQMRDWFNSKAIVAGTIIAIFAGGRLLPPRLESARQHHRPLAAQGPQLRGGYARHYRLWRQPVRLDGDHAAVQPEASRLPAGDRRDLVHPARHRQRHHFGDHRKHPHPHVRCPPSRDRRSGDDSDGDAADGLFLPVCGLLGHRHAGHAGGNRVRAILRATDRRRFRQYSESAVRRSLRRLLTDAGDRRLSRHRGGELALRATDADSFQRAHRSYHALQPRCCSLSRPARADPLPRPKRRR